MTNREKMEQFMVALEKVKKYFERDSIYKLLSSMLGYILPNRKEVKFKLNIGGGSHTDGSNLTVGLPEMYINHSFNEILVILTALLGHEAQHIKSSNFEEFVKYQKEMNDYFIKKHNLNPKILSKTVHTVANAVEDGRIEKILCNRYPGYLKKIQFLNMTTWKEIKLDGKSELSDFLMTIATISVTGLYPINYDDVYTATELDSVVQKIKPYIYTGINNKTAIECLSTCKRILFECEDYLVKLIEVASEEQMQNFSNQPNFGNSEEEETNDDTQNSSHIVPESQNENSDNEENSDGEDGSKEDGKEKEGKGDSDNNKGKEKSKESEESQDGDGKSEDGSGEEDNNSEGEDDNDKSEDSSEANGDDKGTNNSSDSQSTQEAIRELVEELLDEISPELIREAKTSIINSERMKNRENDESKENKDTLSPYDLEKINEHYVKSSNTIYSEIDRRRSQCSIPKDMKSEAKHLRKKIEKLFKDKEALDMRNLSKGVLNQNDLYKVGVKDYNVFAKRAIQDNSNYVGYFLQDGSGSMREGKKDYHSAKALSIMEEGFKGLIPFKIATFASDYDYTEHYTVKRFDESKMNINYSYSAYNDMRASGGNKDGYSIRVATAELMKRPEKDKILFVLSDGLPSAYDSGDEALNDVKSAVKDARKNGILVVAIMFGTETYRNENIDLYKYMYQDNIISCNPQDITKHLTKTLVKIIK